MEYEGLPEAMLALIELQLPADKQGVTRVDDYLDCVCTDARDGMAGVASRVWFANDCLQQVSPVGPAWLRGGRCPVFSAFWSACPAAGNLLPIWSATTLMALCCLELSPAPIQSGVSSGVTASRMQRLRLPLGVRSRAVLPSRFLTWGEA